MFVNFFYRPQLETPLSGDASHVHQGNQQVHDVSAGQLPQDNSNRARPRLIFVWFIVIYSHHYSHPLLKPAQYSFAISFFLFNVKKIFGQEEKFIIIFHSLVSLSKLYSLWKYVIILKVFIISNGSFDELLCRDDNDENCDISCIYIYIYSLIEAC